MDDPVPGIIQILPSPSIHHVPEQPDSFQVAVPLGDQLLFQHLGKLQGTLHDDIVRLERDKDIVHRGNGMNHPLAAERSGKVEEHDIESLPFFVHITPQVFHPLFRVAFDDRIGRLTDSFVLPVQVHLQVVIFHDILHVPLTHQGDAVLRGVTVHNRHTHVFAVMQDTGQQYRKDGFSHATLLAGDGPIKRMFITGVSPVTMDDVTSGFNIGANMTTDYRFNGIIGFSEGEVREMLAYYKSETGFEDSVDDLINLMKPWYDNYRFSTKSLDEPMYNSDMVLYFISNYLPLRSAPDKMIDNNIRTDYNKLRHLIRLDKRFGTNASIIQEIVNNGETTAVIKDAFPAEDIAKPDNFKSLLYYFGLLSIKGTKRGDTLLGVPNLTVREQLYTYLIEAYREADVFSIELYKLHDLVKDMAYDGDWKPVFEYFSSELERQSAIREFIEGEAHVKGFLLAYLGLTRTYIIYPEYEANKGYADFYMMPDLIHQPEIGFSYIVEVKYARRDASETEIEALRAEAAIQLRRYAADPKVHATKGDTELRLVTLVFKGWKLAVCEMDLA